MQAEFQLEKASTIDFVDIGNYGSAFVEVQVRRSSWPEGKSVTMIPATMMMTPQHCRVGKNKCSVKMFTKDHITEESMSESWDRVKVICTQPYKKDTQYGLAFIRLASSAAEPGGASPEAPGPTMMKLAASSPSLSQPQVKKPNKPILSPSWKTNAAFHRQVIAATKEQSGDVGLKNRLLKMSATSENGTDKGSSLGRAAKLVMAATSSGKKADTGARLLGKEPVLSPGLGKKSADSEGEMLRKFNGLSPSVLKTHVSTPIGPTRDLIDKMLKEKDITNKPFTEMVEDFFASMSEEKLKHSTLKALRRAMEQQFLQRKLNSPEKAEFKAKALMAVGRLMSDSKASKSTPKIATKVATTPKVHNKQIATIERTPTYKSPVTALHRSPNINPGNVNRNNALKLNTLSSASTSPKPTVLSTFKNIYYTGSNPSSPNANVASKPKSTSTPKPTSKATPDQRLLPSSQRKRPHSPDIAGDLKAPRRSWSPDEDDDSDLISTPWLQAPLTSTPTSSKSPAATTSQNRAIPPWMAADNRPSSSSSSSFAGTPSRGRGRGRGAIGTPPSRATGERKPCPKCNKSFTTKGIGRHMTNCTGPKQQRSRGRGRQGRGGMGRNSFGCIDDDKTDENILGATPRTSVSLNTPGSSGGLGDTDSQFGLMTTDLVQCPMCSKDFPSILIELHAAMCGGESQVFGTTSNNSPVVSGSMNPIWIG